MATVLVVDDNPVNRELVVTLVKHLRHRPLEAADGADALVLVRKEHPDLVICDILMPTMDGYEFVRQLRADPKIAHTEVIFYSAYYREQEARNLATVCGVSRVLVKPCEPEEILEAIEQGLAHEKPLAAAPLTDEFDREHLRLMTDKLSERAAMLQAANQRLSALTELNLRLASERDPHALLDQVCRSARDLIGAKYAVLSVKERGDGEKVYSTISGIPATVARGLVRPRIDNDVLGPVLTGRKPLRFTIPTGDARAAGLPAGYPPARSVLASPIVSLNSVYGWISLFDKVGADEFSEEDERLLSIHAAQVGRIYENGSLYLQIQRHAAQLEESELRFRQLAENVHQVFFLTNANATKLLYISPAYETVWGRSCESVIARPDSWMEAVHPDDLETVRKGNETRDETGRMSYEYRIVRPDGSLRWISARAFPIRDEAGEIYRLAGIAEDITERKLAEDRITRLNRVYAVLSGINALIVRVSDRDELFREACRIAVEAGHFRLAWIGLVDTEAKALRPVAWYGAGEDYLRRMPLSLDETVADSYGLGGRAVAARKALVANDMASDPRVLLADEATRRGFRSLAMLPLQVSGSVVAILALYADRAGVFDTEEMELLLELAGDIAFALDHIAKYQRLEYLAFYDPLTGVANRSLFHERLAQQVDAAARAQRRLAVVLLDLEQFNTVNLTLGRRIGDELLKQIAARCASLASTPALFARLVSDEFGAVIADVRAEGEVARIIEQKEREIFGPPYDAGDSKLTVAAKFGIAVFPTDGSDADTLLKNAEAALKRAKTTGKRYLFYTQEMTERVAGRLMLESNLRRALERNEYVLHYQPKVDVVTRRIVGVEALMRWQSPDLGLVPPLRFIPLLEETGMIVEVGAWALRQAALDYRQWLEQGLAAPRIAVNVSAVQLRRPDFVDVVKSVFAQSATAPGIDIEITESLIMDDVEGTIQKLKALRALGVGVAIDDFGTGYSSLAYLGRLPLQALKIDRSFIVAMTDDPDAMTLVSTIISLAHSLKLSVIAEGVETEEQATVLRLLRCDEMQGYLISRPVPLAELTPKLLPATT